MGSVLPVTAQQQAKLLKLHAGNPSPEIAGTGFDGRHIALSAYRGKIVVLDFWASWCVPCLQQMPELVQWQQQSGQRGLQIVGVSLDDDPAAARKITAKFHVNYPVLMGTPEIADRYSILGLPEIVLIGRDGKIAEIHTGEESPEKLRQSIERLLNSSGNQ